MLKNLIPAIFCLVLLLGGGSGFYFLVSSQGEPPTEEGDVDPPLVEVVEAIDASNEGFSIKVNGTVVPKREIALAAQISGRIVEKTDFYRAGTKVKQGDLLLRIEPDDYQTSVELLESQIEQVNAELDQLDIEQSNNRQLITLAESDVAIQIREKKRARSLASQDAVGQSDLDAIDARVLSAQRLLQTLINERNTFETRRRALRAQAKRTTSQLEQARRDLERTEIRSPIDGVIVREVVERDGYVRPGDEMAVIEDISVVEVLSLLRMEDLFWRLEGQGGVDAQSVAEGFDSFQIPPARARITYTLGGRTYVWNGVLSRYESGGVDRQTRTIPCLIEVANPGEGAIRLRRGLFVGVELFVDELETPLVRIPREALRPNNDAWLVRENHLAIVPVEPVRMLERDVLIRGGSSQAVRAGDRVIISPLTQAFDGIEVSPQDVAGEMDVNPAASGQDPTALSRSTPTMVPTTARVIDQDAPTRNSSEVRR